MDLEGGAGVFCWGVVAGGGVGIRRGLLGVEGGIGVDVGIGVVVVARPLGTVLLLVGV